MSPKLPRVDCDQLIHALKRAGFVKQRQRGSHFHLRRPSTGNGLLCQCTKGKRFLQVPCEVFFVTQKPTLLHSGSF